MLMMVLAALLQAAPPPKTILIKTIDKGMQSMVETPRQVTVRSADELAKLWKAHAPDRIQPTVDFARDMIVGVFLGSRPTAGYDVQIVSAREDQGALVVRFRLTMPGRDAVAAQVLTMPYHVVVIPRYAGDVKFERVN